LNTRNDKYKDIINRNQPGSIRFYDCLYGGWLLLRDNWILVTGFSILLCVTGFASVIDPLTNTFFTAFNVKTLSTFFLRGLLQFTAIVFIVIRSLLVLNNQEKNLNPIIDILRTKAVKLLILWFIIRLVTLSPSIVVRLFELDTQLFLDYYNVTLIRLFLKTLSGLNTIVALMAQVILVYSTCVLAGNDSCDRDRTIGNSLRESCTMVKITFGKLFFAIFC
jgi:hypothetical protein